MTLEQLSSAALHANAAHAPQSSNINLYQLSQLLVAGPLDLEKRAKIGHYVQDHVFSTLNPFNRIMLYHAFQCAQQEILLAHTHASNPDFVKELRTRIQREGTDNTFTAHMLDLMPLLPTLLVKTREQYTTIRGTLPIISLEEGGHKSYPLIIANGPKPLPIYNGAKLSAVEVEATLFYLDQLNKELGTHTDEQARQPASANAPIIAAQRQRLAATHFVCTPT
ncbi:MAG: hypothetical protein EBX50_17210 [Chitinophagia bacterium]|nr:hypothetical protein [Chitinophagia bacterium]